MAGVQLDVPGQAESKLQLQYDIHNGKIKRMADIQENILCFLFLILFLVAMIKEKKKFYERYFLKNILRLGYVVVRKALWIVPFRAGAIT